MRKKFGSIAAFAATLIILFSGSMLLNDRLRQGVIRVAGDIRTVPSNSVVSAISDAGMGIVGVLKDFSADNPFLFVFLTAAAALVVLMVRT